MTGFMGRKSEKQTTQFLSKPFSPDLSAQKRYTHIIDLNTGNGGSGLFFNAIFILLLGLQTYTARAAYAFNANCMAAYDAAWSL